MTIKLETRFTDTFLRYDFTEEEKREISSEMARQVTDLQRVENEKKSVMSQFKSQIDKLWATIKESANKLNNGYEFRNIKCQMVPDNKRHVWKVYRIDTGGFVNEQKMQGDDLQMSIEEVTTGPHAITGNTTGKVRGSSTYLDSQKRIVNVNFGVVKDPTEELSSDDAPEYEEDQDDELTADDILDDVMGVDEDEPL